MKKLYIAFIVTFMAIVSFGFLTLREPEQPDFHTETSSTAPSGFETAKLSNDDQW